MFFVVDNGSVRFLLPVCMEQYGWNHITSISRVWIQGMVGGKTWWLNRDVLVLCVPDMELLDYALVGSHRGVPSFFGNKSVAICPTSKIYAENRTLVVDDISRHCYRTLLLWVVISMLYQSDKKA